MNPRPSIDSPHAHFDLVAEPAGEIEKRAALPLKPSQREELARVRDETVKRFAQFAPATDADAVVRALERGLVFVLTRVRQEGLDRWVNDLSRIALTWGALFEHHRQWTWRNVVGPQGGQWVALISPNDRHCITPIDVVLDALESGKPSWLTKLWSALGNTTFTAVETDALGSWKIVNHRALLSAASLAAPPPRLSPQ